MNQRQATRQQAQKAPVAKPCFLPPHSVHHQVQSGQQHRPARQEGALGTSISATMLLHLQVIDIELRMVGRRLVPALQDILQPLQPDPCCSWWPPAVPRLTPAMSKA